MQHDHRTANGNRFANFQREKLREHVQEQLQRYRNDGIVFTSVAALARELSRSANVHRAAILGQHAHRTLLEQFLHR